MATVYLHGHGHWTPSMGFTTVPRGCSISFYTHFAKLLNQSMVKQILNGTYTGQFDRTIPAFHTAPNVMLSNLSPALIEWANTNNTAGLSLFMLPPAPHQQVSLAYLMNGYREAFNIDLDFRWLCCQALVMNSTGGGQLGINASDRTAQAGHEGEYLLKWKEGNVEHTKWVKSNSSIHH